MLSRAKESRRDRAAERSGSNQRNPCHPVGVARRRRRVDGILRRNLETRRGKIGSVCHSERSEESSGTPLIESRWVPRSAQNDRISWFPGFLLPLKILPKPYATAVPRGCAET